MRSISSITRPRSTYEDRPDSYYAIHISCHIVAYYHVVGDFIGQVGVRMMSHRLKQSLADIALRVRMPFLVIHYSAQRKRARIERLDGNEYVGYYESTPTVERRWPADKIEWILLASF